MCSRRPRARRRAILIATGSEVEIALAARGILQAQGHRDAGRVDAVLGAVRGAGREVPRAACCRPGRCGSAVEAAVAFGWERWLCGERGAEKKAGFVGMTGFGASGPIEALYPHFGITAEAVAEKAEALL